MFRTRFRRVLLIVTILLVVGILAWIVNRCVFANSLPFNNDPLRLNWYRDIGTVDNLEKLLLAERLFGGGISKESEVLPMKTTTKVLHGDVVYIFDDYEAYRENKSRRPMEYVSFSKVKIFDRVGYVLGEKVKNKNGSVSYLHFGFMGEYLTDPSIFDNVIKMLDNNAYVVPMVETDDCGRMLGNRELCESINWEKMKLLTMEWGETGNVPDELETMLLFPYIQVW